MYLIIQERKRNIKKIIFVETPDEISTQIISITKKIINKTRFGYYNNDYIGYTNDISWEVKSKKYITPLSEYFSPQNFVFIDTKNAGWINSTNKELIIKNKYVTVFPVTQTLTEDEFRVMLNVWSDYKKNVKRTPKQQLRNKERLEYLDILEDSSFFNVLTVIDILT